MDFDSEPRSPPGLLVTKGLDPRLVVDLRAGAMGQLPSSGYGCSQAEAHVGGSFGFLAMITRAMVFPFSQLIHFMDSFLMFPLPVPSCPFP